MKEPLSSVSNAAYLAAGVAGYLGDGPYILRLIFLIACTMLALGSFWFHATRVYSKAVWKMGQRADEMGMYAVFGTLALIVGFGVTGGTWLYVGLASTALLMLLHKWLDSFIVLPVLGALILYSIGQTAGIDRMASVLIVFLAAFVFRAVGELGHSSNDHKWGDGFHLVWHLGTGFGIWLIFASLT